MTPDVWIDLAEAIEAEIEAGTDGIVVMHGTDTMQFPRGDVLHARYARSDRVHGQPAVCGPAIFG